MTSARAAPLNVRPHISRPELEETNDDLLKITNLIDLLETWLLLVPDVQSCGWRSECSAEIRVLKKSMKCCLQDLKELEKHYKQGHKRDEPCQIPCVPAFFDSPGQYTCGEYVDMLQHAVKHDVETIERLYGILKK